ncbi:carbohydrate-binding module family 50 protein [Sodiomyces alcalophilus JCM 7366]|uniref:carbohydrate-binding module family 50 protein n=1 Tax=Sodiomyces alcalophilus JCM 7366 TaxID=591952 RepID=UPI0039B4129E
MPDSGHPTTRSGSSALLRRHANASNAVRPRARRIISADNEHNTRSFARSSSSLFSPLDAAPSLIPSPPSAARPDGEGDTRSVSNLPFNRDSESREKNTLSVVEGSLAQGWTSLQGLASSLLSHDYGASQLNSQGSKPKKRSDGSRPASEEDLRTWSSASSFAMGLDIGFLFAQRSAARNVPFPAESTTSVLEYPNSVNNGLDTRLNCKRRQSDDGSSTAELQESPEDKLVYIHHVLPTDTYAGIVLKYRCREDAFRMLNGLWSRDIQLRRWLALPVDACDIRGRPSPPPKRAITFTELPTRTAADIHYTTPNASPQLSRTTDLHGPPQATQSGDRAKSKESDERPWTHVRWVSLDPHSEPIEIARIAKKTIGCFPPRRQRSLHTTSSISTPRQSLDISGGTTYGGSPDRDSLFSGRPRKTPEPCRKSPSGPPKSVISSTGEDGRPLWMRRPGGVGSMGRNVRSPGPESDYLNAWAKRHLPGIVIDESFPSISVMGSETANFGFGERERQNAATIVESPFDQGHDLSSTSRQGSGLDRAAGQVETWLRNAFTKRKGASSTQSNCNSRNTSQVEAVDLIELAYTLGDDGRLTGSIIGPGAPDSEGPLPSSGKSIASRMPSKDKHNSDVSEE